MAGSKLWMSVVSKLSARKQKIGSQPIVAQQTTNAAHIESELKLEDHLHDQHTDDNRKKISHSIKRFWARHVKHDANTKLVDCEEERVEEREEGLVNSDKYGSFVTSAPPEDLTFVGELAVEVVSEDQSDMQDSVTSPVTDNVVRQNEKSNESIAIMDSMVVRLNQATDDGDRQVRFMESDDTLRDPEAPTPGAVAVISPSLINLRGIDARTPRSPALNFAAIANDSFQMYLRSMRSPQLMITNCEHEAAASQECGTGAQEGLVDSESLPHCITEQASEDTLRDAGYTTFPTPYDRSVTDTAYITKEPSTSVLPPMMSPLAVSDHIKPDERYGESLEHDGSLPLEHERSLQSLASLHESGAAAEIYVNAYDSIMALEKLISEIDRIVGDFKSLRGLRNISRTQTRVKHHENHLPTMPGHPTGAGIQPAEPSQSDLLTDTSDASSYAPIDCNLDSLEEEDYCNTAVVHEQELTALEELHKDSVLVKPTFNLSQILTNCDIVPRASATVTDATQIDTVKEPQCAVQFRSQEKQRVSPSLSCDCGDENEDNKGKHTVLIEHSPATASFSDSATNKGNLSDRGASHNAHGGIFPMNQDQDQSLSYPDVGFSKLPLLCDLKSKHEITNNQETSPRIDLSEQTPNLPQKATTTKPHCRSRFFNQGQLIQRGPTGITHPPIRAIPTNRQPPLQFPIPRRLSREHTPILLAKLEAAARTYSTLSTTPAPQYALVTPAVSLAQQAYNLEPLLQHQDVPPAHRVRGHRGRGVLSAIVHAAAGAVVRGRSPVGEVCGLMSLREGVAEVTPMEVWLEGALESVGLVRGFVGLSPEMAVV
ncbi:hypothetical protein EJ05DRAFT_537824 [Pseudovirgaria hyperparasitica]|uniref:Uncharacterized protein n=1 Tax=Pseudovirgaria hyperparasitica TaxID=470096 RepID=A0A6A6W7D0_9PEZI|nr:uncharacterized protein EJ05DRAFT_537824 [Pseudovirgaria hyperparasitica]KAF2758455.1 hypothetical protein EJ05DRAFT_537824 [Pseudovirgaria hyperparasitica]